MKNIDLFATELFEEAKRFLEKAKEANNDEGKIAFLHAALLVGMSSLEAHVNAICDEMAERANLGVLDKSILLEKEYRFEKGMFKLTKKLRMYNLLDRIQYLANHFVLLGNRFNTNADWWSKLSCGIDIRNSLVHPKDGHNINFIQVEDAFKGILGVLDALYMAIYGQHFPSLGRHFDSKMTF
jgi:hypothetical protein